MNAPAAAGRRAENRHNRSHQPPILTDVHLQSRLSCYKCIPVSVAACQTCYKSRMQLMPQHTDYRTVIVSGPTASGKSSLAMRIAAETGGVIVNADALQVYSCWRVLTARPSHLDEEAAEHFLYGHVDQRQNYSVGLWLDDVREALRKAAERLPIVVGGTGMYISALLSGIAPIPPVPAGIRARGAELERSGGIGALTASLEAKDPETLASIDSRNPARVRRAWEVLHGTGRGLASWQTERCAPVVDPESSLRLLFEADKDWLAARIDRRARWMVANGALEECAALLEDWDPTLPYSRALGADAIIAHLRGQVSLDEAVLRISASTRQYAKRQRTWFRSRMAGWQKVDSAAPCLG